MLVHINLIFACEDSPNSYVKLAALEEQWPFNVLLDDTACKLRSRVDKELHFFKIGEDLNASSLIGIGWFDKPNVVDTVLDGNTFLRCIATLYIFIPLIELSPFLIILT